MTNKLVASLLLASSVNAASGPKKSANTSWPMYAGANAKLQAGAAAGSKSTTSGLEQTKEIDTNGAFFLAGVAKLGGDGVHVGLYSAFRMQNTAIAPLQNIDANPTNDATDTKKSMSVSVQSVGYMSFYQTDKAKEASIVFGSPGTLTEAADGTAGAVSGARTGLSGNVIEAGLWSTMSNSTSNTTNAKAMAKMFPTVISGTASTANDKIAYIYTSPARMTFASSATTETDLMAGVAEGGVTIASDMGADAQTIAMKTPMFNSDIILGTFYQSNGDAAGEWCSNGESTDKTNFAVTLAHDASSANVWQANDGFGPQTKCTWQALVKNDAPGGTYAPVVSLKSSTNYSNYVIQVLEWYDVSNFDASFIIDATKAFASTSIANSNAEYATTKGVFFNPIKTITSFTAITNTLGAGTESWGPNREDDAASNIAGSIGTAIYYDRSTGINKDTVRSLDASIVTDHIYGVYKSVATAYDSAVDTYETSRKAYEAGTETKRPDTPAAPAAFSGMTLNVDNTKTSDNFSGASGSVKAGTTSAAYYANTLAAGVYGWTGTDAAVALVGNNVSYLTVADTTYVDQTTSHAFGRLGQSSEIGITAGGKPFIFQKTTLAKVPGMQVSLFPDATYDSSTMSSAGVSYAKTALTAGDITLNVKAVNALTASDYAVPATTKTPTAVTEPTTGAQALAASMFAAVAVATTLF